MKTSIAHLGISARLYCLAGLLSLALAGVAAYSWVSLGDVAALAGDTEARRVPQLQRMAALELNVTRVSLQLRHAMLARTPEERATALADIGEKRRLIAAALADYQHGLRADDDRQRFAAVPPLVSGFWQVGEANIQLIESGDKAAAFAYLVDTTIPARNRLLQALTQAVHHEETGLHDAVVDIRARASRTLAMLLGVVALTGTGLLLLSWSVSRVLRRRIARSCEVAERVSQGDLALAVRDDAEDEFSPLLRSLGRMQQSLAQVVADVRGNAERVARASAEIAQGNLDLSSRTEQQASALQETAATMEQLGSTVRHNAQSALDASRLASASSEVAQQGGAVVGQVVETMKTIHASSNQIAEIIGVIDDIAFQTNILALNAAVEAARAGDHGRGFAVVAAEVRNLAQRSATAARQIRQLILASVEQVGQGSELVARAGKTLAEIVASIQQVSTLVGEISSASAEQSSGVQQVGIAVSQIDRTTQQNVALVEQSSAASGALQAQAHELVQAVAVFKLT